MDAGLEMPGSYVQYGVAEESKPVTINGNEIHLVDQIGSLEENGETATGSTPAGVISSQYLIDDMTFLKK